MPPADLSRRETLAAGGALGLLSALPAQAQDAAPDPLTLWYRQPAREWVEALPVGNGRLGAMVFGGVATERLQLNEDSFFAGSPYDTNVSTAAAGVKQVRELVWAERYAEAEKVANATILGKPAKQMAYQPIGDLLMVFPGIEKHRGYRRTLDLDGAVARTRFTLGRTEHLREVIASPVDQVIAVRLKAGTGRGGVTVSLSFSTPQKASVTVEGDDTLVMSGAGPTQEGIEGKVRFAARLRLIRTGGTVTVGGNSLYVENAEEVVLLIAMATSFCRFDDISGDPLAITAAQVAAAASKPWPVLLADHQAEHRRLFRRVAIDLGTSAAAALPTDERIAGSEASRDPALAALYHQFGRYLLICSSRPGTQPANLQGIWNEKVNPSWQSKWTLNVNAQMNYWAADMTGLGECVEPLLRMVEELAITGRRTARDTYGARGWMVHNNTDIWRQTAMVDGAVWALWPMGGAWLLSNLWDHWDYSRDAALLRRLFPLMRGACEFYLDTLQVHPRTGELVTNPSNSPENRHPFGSSIVAGPAMDSQLLRDLFARFAAASRLLGRDAALRDQVLAAARRLPRDRVGTAGQLQEWMADWDMAAPDIKHRHVSHLYACYPSDQITVHDTPELARAVRRTLEIRGDDATGWGIGWRLNLWARLEDAAKAHAILKLLLAPSRTYPNMFDTHPPFQIDGNFGGTAGITQMLLQSYHGTIHLLPALPADWPTGSVSGLRVRGNAGVDLRWAGGRLVEAVVSADSAGTHRLRYEKLTGAVTLAAGRRARVTVVGGTLRAMVL